MQGGATHVACASTGNAAAAYAAFCARAGIKLWIFVTSLVPGEKMREAALYGAEVIKVTGTYDQAKVVAAQFAQRHNLHLDRGADAGRTHCCPRCRQWQSGIPPVAPGRRV